MSRIRSIKPEFFRSRSLARCSIPAMVTFEGLWTEADDMGNGIADVDLLKGAIWPKRREITAEDVEDHLVELAAEHIVLYEVNGERYYHIITFDAHQPPSSRRSPTGKYPVPEVAPPPVNDPEPVEILHDESCSHPEGSQDAALPVVLVQGSGVKGQGSGVGAETGALNARRPRDALFEAVATVCGIDWRTDLTPSARSSLNKAVADLRSVDADAPTVTERAGRYVGLYGEDKLTPHALAKHWPQLEHERASRSDQTQAGAVLDAFVARAT